MMTTNGILKALGFNPHNRITVATMADPERQALAPAYNVRTRTERAADEVVAAARGLGCLVKRTGPEDVFVDPTPAYAPQVFESFHQPDCIWDE